MCPKMGIGASVSTAVSERTAVIIEDYMFDASTAGELKPEESPSDFHDTWDLDGTDFTPEASPDDEGYWDDFENIVLNHNYEELGSELAPASDFDNPSNFASAPSSGTVSQSNGTLTFDNTTSTGAQVQLKNRSVSTGKTYKIQFTISNYSAGSFRISVGNQISDSVSANGTYTVYVKYENGLARNYFYTNGSTLTVSNISVKQVDPNDRWTLDSGWSIEDGKLKATSTALEATQTNVFTAGNTYEVTFTIDSIASGSVKVKAGTTSGSIRSSAGTYTQVFDVLFGSSLVFDMHASGSCVIDNVTVKEYAIQPQNV